MTREQSSFLYSANADFIAELYRRYAESPATVDISWRNFFQGLGDDTRSMLAEMGGASWAPQRTDRVISNQNEPAKASAPVPAQGQIASPADPAVSDSYRARIMIIAYRRRGHYMAKLDPLNLDSYSSAARLDLEEFGFTEADLDRPIFIDGTLGFQTATLREIRDRLQAIYCGSIGFEYMHILDWEQFDWLRDRIERGWAGRSNYSRAMKREILQRLTVADSFERFLATKFVGVKRFGLEGGEAMIPAIEAGIATAARQGLREVVVGMAHRGRLNMLTNVLGKPFSALFSEFQGNAAYPDSVQGSGDVKYHLGTSIDRAFDGQSVHLTMNPNPSHLEWVNPVVTGRVRAKQEQRSGQGKLTTEAGAQVMGLLIHGDAAFAGQGIVAETMLLSELKGYRTGGTLHFIINNQVGFTTSPQFSRSGVYSCDSAKMLQAPIFHVNGDDVEAVVFVTQLAAEFRQTFQKDAFIDMVCYRRHGHNEGDEPAFTQPIMYRVIKDHPTTRDIYARQLVAEGSLSQEEVDTIAADFWAKLEGNFKDATSYKPSADWLGGKWQGLEQAPHDPQDAPTGVELAQLRAIGEALSRVPDNFNINPKIAKQLEAKREMVTSGEGIDWATAEALAFGSLLTEGHPVRLSGQDCGRGTFSQRHSVLHDQQTDSRYVPLNNIPSAKTSYTVHDSPLSEAAVMGFDYGYSLAEPNALVCWEGQFGDFANTAQVIIDQFITSSESKWLRMSGITLLLPHGYEGQGPEHSSARLERYLQMCAENNIQVSNCSTPANYFHILRRQVRRNFRKPLVLMTPKSLLRHKLCVSALADMATGTMFRRVIGETAQLVEDKKIRRVVMCSGKVYYDLLATRQERKINDVVLLRLEQFYPFPQKELAAELARYPKADIVWCQEEPENMGAWHFLDRRIEGVLTGINHRAGRPVYAGRPESAATACGSLKRHNKEQAELVDKALTVR